MTDSRATLTVVGLFAGIGGLEDGLRRAGHRSEYLCEIDPSAQRVLNARFDAEVSADISRIRSLPWTEVVAAGFPCQDLSPAGRTAGIAGSQSRLVDHVFRLVRRKRHGPEWVVLENVPFMLQLDGGRAMRYVTQCLEELGYRWAYRVVDTRAFGIPQRRRRVLIVASRKHDPREVLFHGSHAEPEWVSWREAACGFYWTEGNTGLGWAVDAVPTLKGGSGLGIPSPPAIWRLDGEIGIPDIRDAERLQGFRPGWTRPAHSQRRRGEAVRWRLVGNAVSVPVARWLGDRLAAPRTVSDVEAVPMSRSEKWPVAASGGPGEARSAASLTVWPVKRKFRSLDEFLLYDLKPLSARALNGFISRVSESSLRYPKEFYAALERHQETVQLDQAA